MSDNYTDTIQNVVQGAAEPARQEVMDDYVELSSGIVLKVKRVPPLLFQKINMAFKAPRAPEIWIEEKQRKEINYSDPNYIKDMEEYENTRLLANLEALASLGTEVYSVPSGVPHPDEEEWALEYAEFYSSEIPESGKGRYLAWLTLIAILDVSDLQKIGKAVEAKMGVPAQMVAEEMSSFRS